MTAWRIATLASCCAAMLLASPARAQSAGAEAKVEADAGAAGAAPDDSVARATTSPASTTTGLAIYQRFRDGLADPACASAPSTRWRKHFVSAPQKLASGRDDLLPLFGYVVDALREAGLPTEYALIPFVESGYKPGARSPSGPAGLWQMITITARNHKVPIRPGYDGRYSPVDSTRAAVRYLKTLHGMFAGDWRLAVMAYNAGEYRVLGALRRSGQAARNAQPEKLALPDITQAYVRKLHALSCLMAQADDREEWLRALDQPVPRLQAVDIPAGTSDLATWARGNGQDAARLARLNPAFAGGRITRAAGQAPQVLAVAAADPLAGTAPPLAVSGSEEPIAAAPPSGGPVPAATVANAAGDGSHRAAPSTTPARRHVVARGDNATTIARHYGIAVRDLLERNGLDARSVLQPGVELRIDPPPPAP